MARVVDRLLYQYQIAYNDTNVSALATLVLEVAK